MYLRQMTLLMILTSSLCWASQQEGIAPPNPSSPEWRYLTTSTDGQDYYFLPKSRSYYAEVWFKDEEAGETKISLKRYDCESGADRLLQVNTFRGNQSVGNSVYKDSEWGYSEPKTIGAAMLRAACGERKREWTYIGGSERKKSHFLKLDSFSRNGKFVRVWSQTSEGEVRKSVTLFEFDCTEQRIRTIQSTTYIGSEPESSTRPNTWTYAVPGTVGEMLLKVTCQASRPTKAPSRRNQKT
jgi:hypothetical protein